MFRDCSAGADDSDSDEKCSVTDDHRAATDQHGTENDPDETRTVSVVDADRGPPGRWRVPPRRSCHPQRTAMPLAPPIEEMAP